MDQKLRNALRRRVAALRERLVVSAREQLESTYGILPDSGEALPPESVPPVSDSARLRRERDEILTAIDHEKDLLRGSGRTRQRAVEMFVLQAAFGLLNRLAALKVMENRGLVPEVLQDGDDSEGFRLFRQLAPSVVRGNGKEGYRWFLELLFDDVARDVGLVFDRTSPATHLFPAGNDLSEVLELLNDPALDPAWSEDEVLGWIYQYFTPTELREQVRSESSAPRNTYELAIRNQFYTPDYVVGFLAENTLGRLWAEIHPDTSLRDRPYFVPDPNGGKGHPPPTDDVRELKVLDPACGSGHFLHYCFELLETIYREAYESHPVGAKLRYEYPEAEGFWRAVPGLILRHNLFGIDIDLRATQLTALSLYLKAKAAHPQAEIERVNAVHAAPTGGSEELREEFLARLEQETQGELLKRLLRGAFEELDKLAGEAGTLLQPEVRMRERIAELKSEVERAKARQLGMSEILGPDYEQGELPIEAIPDEEFWQGLENRLIDLLREYAGEVAGHNVERRLFADDAVHGMGFIDALMREYDVVLMNPPFGKASKPSKKYIDSRYPRTKNDVYAAFVERGLQLLKPGGYLGAITSRTGFFLTSFQKWREEILLEESDVVAFADLGHGVLDTAMVETAAYVLRARDGSGAS